MSDYVVFAVLIVFIIIDKFHTGNIIKGLHKQNSDLTRKFMAKNLTELTEANKAEIIKPTTERVQKENEKRKETIDEQLDVLRNTPEITD